VGYAKNAVVDMGERRYHAAADTIMAGNCARHPATGEWISPFPIEERGRIRLLLERGDYYTPVKIDADHRSIVRALHVFDIVEEGV